MKNANSPDPDARMSTPMPRRALLAGVGAAGAAVVAAKLMPAAAPVEAVVAAAPKTVVDTAGGYRLSEHVKRYYATTRS